MCAAVCISAFLHFCAGRHLVELVSLTGVSTSTLQKSKNKKTIQKVGEKDLAMHRRLGTYDKADTYRGSDGEKNEKPNRKSNQVLCASKARKTETNTMGNTS